MTKTPITLQDLRRRLYVKAKAEPSWRFWGLYTHVCKPETLRAAYELAKQNDGAPGTDGVTFEAIEIDGVERFLDQLREELVQRCYRPQRPRKVGIPRRRLGGWTSRKGSASDFSALTSVGFAVGEADGCRFAPHGGKSGRRSCARSSRFSEAIGPGHSAR